MGKLLAILLGTSNKDELRTKGIRLALLVPAFRWMDWVAVGITGSLVAFLKWHQFSSVEIFFILWVANIVYSGIIVQINDLVKTDILLMEALRRAVDTLIERSRVFGYLIEAALILRLVVWDGPDNFILFFRSRLVSNGQRIVAFVTASGIQMAIWTVIYVTGYEIFS